MKYNCPWCDWIYEGQSHGVHIIIKHEHTHPENTQEAYLKRKQDDGEAYNPVCSWCGCDQDHKA